MRKVVFNIINNNVLEMYSFQSGGICKTAKILLPCKSKKLNDKENMESNMEGDAQVLLNHYLRNIIRCLNSWKFKT